LPPSIKLLENLGIWEDCKKASAPLDAIRIIDARGGLVRAPELHFTAAELGLKSLGANVPNSALNAALGAAVQAAPHLTWLSTAAVARVEAGDTCVRIQLAEGGTLEARLLVAADGRNSIARAAAGIATRGWDYPQSALATSFAHGRQHSQVTFEFHRRAGPFTTVPLPGNASSLVWVEEPARAEALAALPEAAFADLLEEHLSGLLGRIGNIGSRSIYRLSGQHSEKMGQNRIALVGEAARVIPPIGAQGLNLGLRDAATLADCVADARSRSADIGSDETLADYHEARTGDAQTRMLAVNLLNRTLLSDFLPVQAIRGLGAHLLSSIPPLRRYVVDQGLGLSAALPRLMRASD
jgi:2-octaprenyl-6-methoxyphenol hydroxylase